MKEVTSVEKNGINFVTDLSPDGKTIYVGNWASGWTGDVSGVAYSLVVCGYVEKVDGWNGIVTGYPAP